MEDLEATKARRNGGRTLHEPYSVQRMEMMKRLITKFDEKGRKKRYSISVDGEIIIPTTYEVEEFDEYLDYVEPTTEVVEIRTYFGDSPNCNRYIFYLKQTPVLNGPVALQGPADPQSQIQQALEKQQLETKIMLLEEELKRKKKKLRNYKGLKEQLEEKQVDIKELMVKGMELYGAFKGGGPGMPSPIQGLPPAEVEIERELSPSDKHYAQLKELYGERHLQRGLKLWELFIQHPELQAEFTELITIKKNQNG